MAATIRVISAAATLLELQHAREVSLSTNDHLVQREMVPGVA
jgi:hypothetical protein